MIAVSWRVVCHHPSGWLEPLSPWGNFEDTESLLAEALILGLRRLRLQSTLEAFQRVRAVQAVEAEADPFPSKEDTQ